ncbi:AAA family ATPase [Bacillus spongiae]|uniref:AAA family ATPase n=1 Tax=Bacillus spongiae TaxID=2683610 RepID=A0ABU8HB02_9BACI
MKIMGFHIYGYGKVADFSVQNLQDIQVIYGENEAGKSSIQHFFHSILFGFPTRAQNEPRYEPLHHSAYGGKIIIETNDYGEVVIERKKGRAVGDVFVYFQDGSIGGEKELALLLHNIDKSTFQNIFSFDVHGLQNINTFSEEEISRYLFSAGMSGTDELFQLENLWEKQKSQLFKKNGKKPVLNEMLQQLKRLEKELKKGKQVNSQYAELLKLKRSKEASFDKQKYNQRKWKEKEQELLAYQQKLPLIEERQGIEHQLTVLEKAKHFPSEGLERYEQLNQTIRSLEMKLQNHNEKQDALKKELALSNEDRFLLSLEQEMETFLNEEHLIQQKLHLVYEHQNKLEMIQSSISNRMRKLNIRADEGDLIKIDTGMLVKTEVKDLLNEKIEFQSGFRQFQNSFSREEEELKVAEQQCSSIESLMLSEEEYQQLQKQAHHFEKRMEIEKQRNLLINQQNTGSSIPNYWFLMTSMALIIGMIVTVTLSQYIPFLLLFGCEVLTLFLYSKNRNLSKKSHGKVAKIEQKQETIQEYVDPNVLKEQRQLRVDWKQKLLRLDELQFRFQNLKEAMAEWEETQLSLENRFGKLKHKLSLSADLQWDVLEEAFQELDNLIKETEQKGIYEKVITTNQKQLKDFEEKWKNVLTGKWTVLQEMFTEIKYLSGRLKEFKQKDIYVQEKLTSLKEEQHEWETEKEYLQKEITRLFQQAQVTTEEQYRIAAEGAKQRKELLQKLKLIDQQLSANELRKDYLISSSTLKRKLVEAKQEINQSEERIEEIQEEIVKLNYEIEKLEEGTDYAILLHQYYEKKAEFQTKSQEWAIYAAAQKALNETMNRYKEDRLPKVMAKANDFLKRLTNNQYTELHRDENQQLLVKSNESVFFSPKQLSQATKEQVYVSLRLALVVTLKGEFPFPLIIDDGFVHFDAKRTEAVIDVLKECSQQTQIIYFTCHSHIAEKFPKQSVLDLSVFAKV